ncbi:MAG: ATP-binding protein [Planctomycetales bacterium]|nr:ATP-binding protein [Planctomycetales bacterium]
MAARIFVLSDPAPPAAVVESLRGARVHRALDELLADSDLPEAELVVLVPATPEVPPVEEALGKLRRRLPTVDVAVIAEGDPARRAESAGAAATLPPRPEESLRSLLPALVRQGSRNRVLAERLRHLSSLAGLGELVAGVAHELNNPLSGVLGYSQLLLRRPGLPEDLRADLTKLAADADRAARVARGLLRLARRHAPERGPVDVNAVVREAVDLLSYELRVRDIEVVLKLSTDLPAVPGDAHRLEQVLLNLVANSGHAIAGVAPRGTVTITSRREPNGVLVRVADSGPGVPPEVRARLFEPFVTTKPVGQGTGLGLSLCAEIVREHGGEIGYVGRDGEGAVFEIRLPESSGVFRAPRAAAGVAGCPPEPGPAAGRRVLIVDDEPAIRDVLGSLLRREGHVVDAVADGAAALAAVGRASYDLIVCDIRMPVVDGPTFYEAVRQRHPELTSRLFFLTGDTVSPPTIRFLEESRLPYRLKPFRVVDLLPALTEVLGGAARREG